jgi:hypothetical protein
MLRPNLARPAAHQAGSLGGRKECVLRATTVSGITAEVVLMDRVISMTFCAGPKIFPGFHLVPSLPTEDFQATCQ